MRTHFDDGEFTCLQCWDWPGVPDYEVGHTNSFFIEFLRLQAPQGRGWALELKMTAIVCKIRNGRVRLYTMNGNDWTKRYPRIVEEAARLREPLIIDAEVVHLSAQGVADFDALHSRTADEKAVGCAFGRLKITKPSPNPGTVHRMDHSCCEPGNIGSRSGRFIHYYRTPPYAGVYFTDIRLATRVKFTQRSCRC